LAALLGIFDQAKLNIEYMYAFSEKRGDKALMVFRVADPDTALRALQASGINVDL
jgi:hypothetical protein